MDEDKKQKVMVGLLVSCLVLVAALNVPRFFKGGSGSSARTVDLICLNPECASASEITRKEYQEALQNSGMAMNPMGMAGPVECPKCEKISAARGIKCKECSTVFMQRHGGDDYPDRCPDCGYSDIENRRSK